MNEWHLLKNIYQIRLTHMIETNLLGENKKAESRMDSALGDEDQDDR